MSLNDFCVSSCGMVRLERPWSELVAVPLVVPALVFLNRPHLLLCTCVLLHWHRGLYHTLESLRLNEMPSPQRFLKNEAWLKAITFGANLAARASRPAPASLRLAVARRALPRIIVRLAPSSAARRGTSPFDDLIVFSSALPPLTLI